MTNETKDPGSEGENVISQRSGNSYEGIGFVLV